MCSWSAHAIGPRVGRLLLAQLLLVTLVAGVSSSLIVQLAGALRVDEGLRAATLASITLATALSREVFRHALCPSSLAVLRRQPLGKASFAALALPWTVPFAWPWAAVLALGHPDTPLPAIAGGVVGTLLVAGVAAAGTPRALAAWTLVPLAALVSVDRASVLAGPILLVAGTGGVALAGRAVRDALAPVSRAAGGGRGRWDDARTPFGALLALDRSALRTSLHWLHGAWVPLAITLYVVVLRANGNCRGACLDGAAILVATFGAGFAVIVLDALRRVHGARLLVPDRVVPTRLRLASLFVATVAPLALCAVPLAILARDATALPHAAAVALAVLWRQLRDPTRAAELGPLVWLLIVPTSVVLLPEALRFVASVLVALGFALLVDRRGAELRAELAAARGPSERY